MPATIAYATNQSSNCSLTCASHEGVRNLPIHTEPMGNGPASIPSKNRHQALKRSRISRALDFGQRWFSVARSRAWCSEITPILDMLATRTERGELRRDLEDKEEVV